MCIVLQCHVFHIYWFYQLRTSMHGNTDQYLYRIMAWLMSGQRKFITNDGIHDEIKSAGSLSWSWIVPAFFNEYRNCYKMEINICWRNPKYDSMACAKNKDTYIYNTMYVILPNKQINLLATWFPLLWQRRIFCSVYSFLVFLLNVWREVWSSSC